MDIANAAEFEISISTEPHDPEGVLIWGPRWPCPVLASRDEAKFIVDQIRHCCVHPNHFGIRLVSGDMFAVSHLEGWVLIRFCGVLTRLDPHQADTLANAISAGAVQLPPPSLVIS
jgi:hypothetical protein